jgi:glycosyltransferase involved in cell wall biosynthesis
MLRPMRVALVHDWLTGMRGGERILHELALLHPEADLYTLFHVPGTTSPAIESLRIHTSLLNRLPGASAHYRKALPLYPWAIRRFRLEGYDLVVSTSHAVAKSIPVSPGTPHLDYCLTPMRYVWDQVDSYLGRGPFRALATPLVRRLRQFDVAHSSAQEVTRFVAISNAVADRIRRHYGREASVVHPPVDVDRITPSGARPDDFYLMVGGFVSYKREDIALDAFRGLDRKLVVVGDGPQLVRARAHAPPNCHFTGHVPDHELAALYADCRALVYPQEEDFGISAVEAQAAGRPVIAFGRGGALDTVRPLLRIWRDGAHVMRETLDEANATGLYFEPQDADGLRAAILAFEENEHRFDPKRIRGHAENFSTTRFRHEIQVETQRTLEAALG